MNPRVVKRVLGAFVAALVGVGLLAVPRALAHAGLESSTPSPSAVLAAPPPFVVLDFDEDLETPLTSIQLYDQNGVTVVLGSPAVGADGSIVQASVPNLADGTYAVVWRVTSADGHVVDGAFSFQVGVGGGVDSTDLIDRVSGGAHSDSAVVRALGVARFASFAGAAVVIGGLFMVMLAGAHVVHEWATRRLLWFGWALLALAALANFSLLGANAKAGSFRDMFDTSVWGDVAGTRTGGLLVARMVIAVLFLPVLSLGASRQRNWWPTAVPLLGMLTVFTFSGSGHPSVISGPAPWIAVDAIHFGFVALWLGGLAMMAFGGNAWLRDDQRVHVARSFSRLATVAIPLIIATGVLQTWKLAGGWSNLTETTWGRVLLAKGAVVVLLISLGGAARWLLANEGPANLRRMVVSEAVCAIAVLGLAAGLVAQPPALTVRAKVFTSALTEGGVIVDVSLTPGHVGANEVHFVVTPPGGNLAPIVGITARMSLASRNIPALPVTIELSGSNHFTGNVALPFAGDWSLEIVVEPVANQTVLFATTVPIP